MIFLVFSQFAVILAAQIGITNAVRETARLAATTTPTTTTAEVAVNGQGVYTALADSSTGLLSKNVFAYTASGLVTSGLGDTMICYRTGTDPAGDLAVIVRVDASYVHPLFIPLVSSILDGLDGNSSDGGLRIGANEEMRVENDKIFAYGGDLSSTPTCYNP